MRRSFALACFLAAAICAPIPVLADCEEEVNECLADTEAAGDACYDSCDADDASARRDCRVRCETRLTRRQQQCTTLQRECESNAAASDDAALFGSQRSGADGCYFGECPDDVDEPKPSPRKPVQRRQPEPEPEEDVVDDWWQRQQQQQPPSTAICQTPAFWCEMYVRGPVGASCYCNSLFGPVYGVTVPERN
jgi:hypothetical protein